MNSTFHIQVTNEQTGEVVIDHRGMTCGAGLVLDANAAIEKLRNADEHGEYGRRIAFGPPALVAFCLVKARSSFRELAKRPELAQTVRECEAFMGEDI